MAERTVDVTIGAHDNTAQGLNSAATNIRSATDRMRSDFSKTSSDARAEMDRMRDNVQSNVAGMAGQFSGLVNILAKIPGGFAAIGAVAGLVGMSKLAAETANMTESAMDLSRTLGITTNQASIWQVALADVGASQSELEAAGKALARGMKENEGRFNQLGLATRDSSGALRPMNELMQDAIRVVNDYAPGIARAQVAQELLGRSVEGGSKILLLNNGVMTSAKESAEELNLIVGGQSVEAWKKFDEQADRADLLMKSFKKTLGDAVIPLITDFNAAMNGLAGGFVIIKGALAGLITAFYVLKDGVEIVMRVIWTSITSITTPILGLSQGIMKILTGDFAGAAKIFGGIGREVSQDWVNSFDRITANAIETKNRVSALFGTDKTVGAGGAIGGGKSAPAAPGSTSGGKSGGTPLRDGSDATGPLEAYRKNNEQIFKLSDIRRANQLAADLGEIDAAEKTAQHHAQIGKISSAKLIEQQLEFIDRRYALQAGDIQSRIDLANTDPSANPEKVAEMEGRKEAVFREFSARRLEISRSEVREQAQMWTDLQGRMSSLWDQGVNAMLNGTLTWSNAMRGIGREMITWFITDVVGKPVKAWLLGETLKTGATEQGVAIRIAMEIGASIKSIAIWSATAIKNILVSAWSAMAAAWAAISAIPVIGPALAPVVAGATFLGVAALAGSIASAEGGYDIPRGVNPITQLHEREMVLPRAQADAVRGMADGDGGGGGGPITINVSATDSAGVRRFFMDNKSALSDAIKSAVRDGKR